MLVRVLTDIGGHKPVPLLARVLDERDDGYTIVYLSATEDKDHGRTVYRYEDDPYEIDDDFVVEYLDDEGEAGFKPSETDAGWIKNVYDSDDDYEPSDEGESLTSEDDEDLDEEEFEAEEECYDDED